MTVELEVNVRLTPETVDDGPVSSVTVRMTGTVLGLVNPNASRPPGPTVMRYGEEPKNQAKVVYLAHTNSPDSIPAAWLHADNDSPANDPLTQAGNEVYVDSAKAFTQALARPNAIIDMSLWPPTIPVLGAPEGIIEGGIDPIIVGSSGFEPGHRFAFVVKGNTDDDDNPYAQTLLYMELQGVAVELSP